jgi:hypothetical protein
MSKQSFIYNSSNPTGQNVNNPFNVEKSALIRAAGLTETVEVYFSVGRCLSCGTTDVIWEPLMICGQPVTISPDNNMIVLGVPGQYALGNPTTPLVLAGDVNISKEENVAQWQLPKVCPAEEPPCEPIVGGLQTSW